MPCMQTAERLIAAMRQEFSDDWQRIVHALAVLEYAREVAEAVGADQRIVEAAAVLHDIGIQQAERKHGCSSGKYQEIEGPPIAARILRAHAFAADEIARVCEIVANHHSAKCLETPEFCAVWDADWLVNIPDQQARMTADERGRLVERVFRTQRGRELAQRDVVDPVVSFRTATVEDAGAIRELAEEIWHQHYPSIISGAQIEYMLEWMYNSATVAQELQSGTIWQFVVINGERSGYLSVTRKGDRLCANKLYLKSEWQGRGVGQRLVRQITAIACAFGLESVYLSVNRANSLAIAAYKKAGFEVTEERVKQLERGYLMDDYVMTLRFDAEDAP